MKLFVGLGNPGPKYELTRHNIGFMLIDHLATNWQCPAFRSSHQALVTKCEHKGSQVLLVKPQTFMNLSGQAVGDLVRYYHVALPDLIVIHDEVDLNFGEIKLHTNRGPGGHNGIKHIHECLGSPDYRRLRMGVGRPNNQVGQDLSLADYVLHPFSKFEQSHLPSFLDLAEQVLDEFLKSGFEKTSSIFNSRKVNLNGT